MAAVPLLRRASGVVSKAVAGLELHTMRLPERARAVLCTGHLANHAFGAASITRRASSSSATATAAAIRHSRKYKVPTLKEVESMPVEICEMGSVELVILAEQGHHEACAERLTRDIMRTDGVEWVVARTTLQEIRDANRKVVWRLTVPHQVGIVGAFVAGFGCIPLVFHRGCAEYFNHKFVTTDIPEPRDLETFYEVGTWTWGWMEPVLGTASFTLLALQFMRAQMQHIDLHPYTDSVKEWRGDRLAALYPQYNEDILKDFAKTASLSPMRSLNVRRVHLLPKESFYHWEPFRKEN